MELTFTEIDDLDMNIPTPLTYFEPPITAPKINSKTNKKHKTNSKTKIIPDTIPPIQASIEVQKTNLSQNKSLVYEPKLNQEFKQELNPLNQNPNPNPNLKPSLKQNASAISYNDILKNMNLTLINGKLEFAPQHSKSVHFQEEEFKEPERYITREELIKQKIIDYANYRNEMLRASNIKSTRLQFTNNNNPSIYTRTQQTAFNSLFTLKK